MQFQHSDRFVEHYDRTVSKGKPSRAQDRSKKDSKHRDIEKQGRRENKWR